jgi:hypothetical protein
MRRILSPQLQRQVSATAPQIMLVATKFTSTRQFTNTRPPPDLTQCKCEKVNQKLS